MPTTPAGAKKPQDRKPSASEVLEQELSEDELLADLPELKAPGRLRVRDRNRVLSLSLKLSSFAKDSDEDYSGLKKADLLAEIERRNADLDDDERIVPASERNVDLVAALEANDVGIHIDVDDPRMPLLLDVLADIDEFAESIAADKDAYVEWSLGKGYDVFSALLSRYSSAVGESTAS
jgi:hypothetical protein